jgi:hypothetical protein
MQLVVDLKTTTIMCHAAPACPAYLHTCQVLRHFPAVRECGVLPSPVHLLGLKKQQAMASMANERDNCQVRHCNNIHPYTGDAVLYSSCRCSGCSTAGSAY